MVERTVEYSVVGIATNQGWFCKKIVWPGHKGAPDHVFIKDGRTVWIEFKDRGEPLGVLQKLKHDEMKAAGAEVYAVDTVRRGAEILGLTLPRRYGQII